MNFTSNPQATAGQFLRSSTTQEYALGTRAVTRDGRVFRYAKVGAVALVVGSVYQGPAPIANHINSSVAAASVGDTSLTVTPGNTAGAANLYAEGHAIISTTPGVGYAYGISGHAAIVASTAFTLNLFKDEPIQVALTTASKVDLMQNPYSAVVVTPTTVTSAVVGVAVYAAAASEFCWLQTWGPCAVLIDGTPAVGNAVSPSGSVGGAAAINSGTLPILGEMLVVGVDTKVKDVFLKIAG